MAAVFVWVIYRLWVAYETVEKHDSRIDDVATTVNAHGRQLAAIDKELIDIHQSILRLDLAFLKEFEDRDIADIKKAGR